MIKLISKATGVVVALLMATSCDDSMLQKSAETGGKVHGRNTGNPGDIKANPGESYRFPQITETEFIPSSRFFNHMKCLTWKITWPTYDSDYDRELIPTALSLNNGELNSINFLNATHPENTFNATMSLYYNADVESANTMWSELDYSFDAVGSELMETVFFAKGDVSLDQIQDWVTERPDLFEERWPGADYTDLEYEEGDFIHFLLSNAKQYGGIRIVSMSPRIIEVYLAVPN